MVDSNFHIENCLDWAELSLTCIGVQSDKSWSQSNICIGVTGGPGLGEEFFRRKQGFGILKGVRSKTNTKLMLKFKTHCFVFWKLNVLAHRYCWYEGWLYEICLSFEIGDTDIFNITLEYELSEWYFKMRNDHGKHTGLSNNKNHSLAMTMHWFFAQRIASSFLSSLLGSPDSVNVLLV